MFKIKFIEPLLPTLDEYTNELKEIWENRWLTNKGVKHNSLEKKTKEILGVKNVSLFTNGHLALESIIEVFELKGEIITTAFTFPSTVHAIIRKGCTPVFCDTKINQFIIDEDKIEELITKDTVAILPAHILGQICNVNKIDKIAKKYNLKVIYDSAHAFGVKVKGVGIGNFGDACMFSLNTTKVVHSIEGGVVTFKDEQLYQKLELIKYFGIVNGGDIEYIGSNLKMNEFQATMGLLTIGMMDNEITQRERIFDLYLKRLGDLPMLLPSKNKQIINNFPYFPILLKDQVSRDKLNKFLNMNGIETKKYFDPIATEYTCYKVYKDNQVINSFNISKRIICLPIYGRLKMQDVETICSLIIDFEL